MLSMRRRGNAQNWYIRGKVALGARVAIVPEYCTGTRDRDAASHLMAAREQELREELLFGPRAVTVGGTIADAFEAYLAKPKVPNSTDVVRIGVMNERIGAMALSDPKAAWHSFREAYLTRHAPAGQDRYRSLLQAAINVYNERHDLPPFKLKAIRFDNQRIRFLSHADRDRLIASYVAHVRPIATMFAFQGPRTQEALQLVWGAGGVDVARGTIFFARTKTGNPRTVEIHPCVDAVLRPMWIERGRPNAGHVFLNRLGEPYTDTRDLVVQGGNPLQSAHETACKRAGIADFTVHDWRHHWASHSVMAGVDLITVMRLGGWKSLRMVQRYAAVDTSHMKEAVRKMR
jgi:integrase